MTIPVYRPYPFRDAVDPALVRGLKRLRVRFETRLHPRTEAMVVLLQTKVTADLLPTLPRLRVIANVAVGYDNVDVPACTTRGILLTNTPDVLTDATADIAWALLLAAARRVTEGDRFVRAGKFKRWEWTLMRGVDVHGKTLGIVGAGRIGQAVARRARGFSMRILYTARARKPGFERETDARRVDLKGLLRESDFVSIHVPLSPETRHLVGAKELALMKRTAVLVNTARGPIVDEAALARVLRSGRLFAAGLDVYEKEPEVHAGLLGLENVALLPHVGSATDETRRRMYETALRNLVAVLEGRRPPNPVNAQVLVDGPPRRR
jgi:glyoxylate reductase